MSKTIVWSILGSVVAGTIGIIIIISSCFSNKPPVNNSAQTIFLFSDERYRDSNFAFDWTSNAIASTSSESFEHPLTCPNKSTEAYTFLSLIGHERDIEHGWQAYAAGALSLTSHQVLEPNLKPSGFVNGSPGARYIHDVGGNYSLGLACTQNNGATVDSVSYRFIYVEAHTGVWKASPEQKLKKAD